MGNKYPIGRGGAEEARAFRNGCKAESTGEKRPPKKGEWYLSGSIVEAYYAPNDLPTPFVIARLVQAAL